MPENRNAWLTFWVIYVTIQIMSKRDDCGHSDMREESPGSREQGCRLTAGGGDSKESAAEKKRPFRVSVKMWGKSSQGEWRHLPRVNPIRSNINPEHKPARQLLNWWLEQRSNSLPQIDNRLIQNPAYCLLINLNWKLLFQHPKQQFFFI